MAKSAAKAMEIRTVRNESPCNDGKIEYSFIKFPPKKMRITLDIDDEKVKSILKLTSQKKKSPALAMALDEYLAFKKRQAFVNRVMAGETDYQASNDEVETLAHQEP